MFSLTRNIGIDLGTTNTLVYIKGKGIVIREPSVVAFDLDTNTILAVGEEANRMLGRTPGNITAIRPLKEGVIANFDGTQMMLKYFIRKCINQKASLKPHVVVSVPSGITGVEKRAVLEAVMQAGAKETYLVPGPMAAALGAGLPAEEPTGSMVVDIGGGTTEVAVISLGGVVTNCSNRVGGDNMDEALSRYIKRTYSITVSERTVEQLKVKIGSALPVGIDESMEVRGRDTVTGLPKFVAVTAAEVQQILSEAVNSIVNAVRSTLEKAPVDLASDIIDRGIVMTGGGALLKHLDRVLSRETGIPVYVAENSQDCAALGTGKILDNLQLWKKYQMKHP
jgi:rod shape-determining protein MreB